jgi:hypothetical protein
MLRLTKQHHRDSHGRTHQVADTQIGTPGFKSESVAGFLLECVAGFVQIRSQSSSHRAAIKSRPNICLGNAAISALKPPSTRL